MSHAYMIVGPEGPEREEAARRLAAAMLCRGEDVPCGQCRDCRKVLAGIHPDVITLQRAPDDKGKLRKEIVVEQIRAITADAVVAPNEGKAKVYIIREADLMNPPAQNALLKSLEEPPGHACFVLCTASADALLTTVRSRCVRVDDTRLAAESDEPVQAEAAEFLALAAARDKPGLVRFCMLRTGQEREQTEQFLAGLDDEVSRQLLDGRAASLPAETLWHLKQLIARGQQLLRVNIGSRQVFGLLAAQTLD